MINFVITLKWVLLVIHLTQVNADDTHGIEKRGTSAESKKVVCYYTNWSVYRPGTAKFSPQNINPYLCTHLIYAFGGLDKDNGLRPYDKYQDIEQGGYAKFTGLKTYNKNLKTLIAIGGWNEGSSRFSSLVADEERRGIFVKNVVKFLRQNNFDGLDLDWEYPAFRDGSKSADRENYASLVKELREEFEKESSKTGRNRLLLTMAVPAGVEYIDKGYDIPKLNKYLDFMNILSYDYHSAYEPNANHHSPLYSLQEESEYNFDSQLTIDYTIKHYLKKGVDPEKLILGIPTYGRSYTLFNPDSTDLGAPADGPGEQGESTREKGYLSYFEICNNIANDKEWKIVQPKKSAMGPFAYRGNQWVGYDDIDIVKLKAKFVNDKGLGGIMFWSIDNDDFRGKCHGKPYPLIEASKEALLATSGSSINAITSPSEEKRSKLGNRKNRPKAQSHSTTAKPTTTSTTTASPTTTTFNPLSTPEPPTTPDPGTDFVCKEEGFFPHPRDCKKYFWCLDSGPSNLGIVAHQFTCPTGLMFNKAADSCDYSRNVICNKKSDKSTSTTTTAKPTTTTSAATKQGTTTTTTTTTTTAEPEVEEEYEEQEDDDVDSQEDPKAIKQLITLIKKLGGIAELEKQLKIDDGSVEATTPAISKTLYNKVFSSPNTNRFKNQQRNGPSGPQNEGLSSNDNVPYYKKEKPQYVTIQRSRPLKNVPQDAEDSGTTNNKSVQPSKYQDTADYVDEVTEAETTTVRHSSPRYRSSTVDSKSTSLKYVVLERNRADRTTTEDEELTAESPSSTTTQRYITLVRQRPSTTSSSISTTTTEEEETAITTTEPPTARPTQRHYTSRHSADERATEKSKDKVSEPESISSTPVTSAQTIADKAQTLTTTTTYDYPDTTTNLPNTYLVFPVKIEDMPKGDLNKTFDSVTSTEPYITSTVTSIITTVRESPTQKTRIPLRRYKEYLKQNKTDIFNEILSNDIPMKNTKEIRTTETNYLTTETPSTKRNFSRRRFNYTNPTTESSKAPSSTEGTTTHSRFFLRRGNKGSTGAPIKGRKASTEIIDEINNTLEVTANSKEIESHESEESTPKYRSRFRSKYKTTPQSEGDPVSDFFKKRRSSTTPSTPETTSNPFSKSSSRYFSRGRKTSPADESSSTESTTSTKGGRYVAANLFRKTTTSKSEILNSDENRYEIPDITSRPYINSSSTKATAISDQPQTTVRADANSKEIETTTLLELTTINQENSTTELTSSEIPTVHLRSEHYPKTYRNNSRFLKNPEPEYHKYFDKVRENDIRGHAKYSADEKVHRFNSPIYVVQKLNDNQIDYPYNDNREKTNYNPGTKARVAQSSEKSNKDIKTLNVKRGRTKFADSIKAENSAFGPQNNATDAAPANYKPVPRGRSRPIGTNFVTSSYIEFYGHDRTHEPFVAEKSVNQPRKVVRAQKFNNVVTDSYATETRGRQTVNVATESRSRQSPRLATDAYVTETKNTVTVSEQPSSTAATTKAPRRSRIHYINTSASTESVQQSVPESATHKLVSRGKIKAKVSLSTAEIRELESLKDAPPEVGTPRKKPKTISEETFITNTDNFDYTKLYTIPTLNERIFEETTDSFYLIDGNGITRDNENHFRDTDVFRVSETKYSNNAENETPKENVENTSSSVQSTVTTERTEPSSRYRENFRRTSTPRTRYRSTTSTTTTEYTPTDSNKLANRFRRRKIKPENRSISTGRNENLVSTSYQSETSTTRPKSIDISQRGSTTISDFLPAPEPLYRINQTVDQLSANGINNEDPEAQTINTQTNYYNTEDVSDLADPAVVAIHNLKTLPPSESQVTYSKAIPSPVSQITPVVQPQVTYTQGFPVKPLSRVKIPSKTTLSVPVSKSRSSIRRGTSKVILKSTTTQLPPLQDIYNDYHETDFEYHADPVEIPIAGKVRIHSDGYIECLDMGNFPHPFSCKKFISCAKMEYDSLLGWEYTCPKGLSFDPIGGICNWAAGLGCKE